MVFGGWLDYEKTGSVDGPVLCMGFDGIAVGVRWVMMLYAIFLQNLPYSVGFCDVVCLVFLHLQWRWVAGAVCKEEG